MKTISSNSYSHHPSVRTFALFALALLAWPKLDAAHAQTTPFQHRWAGFVFDTFTLDGGQAWTVEDGGRIRHRPSAVAPWSFQNVPNEVTGPLRRIHFLPDALTGWAVGDDGWIINTTNGGGTWNIAPFDPVNGFTQVPAVLPPQYRDPLAPDKEQLWDVFFLDTMRGWLCGLHGIWKTTDGGAHWIACRLYMQGNPPVQIDASANPPQFPLLRQVELYAMDVVERSDGTLLGMASAEPGLVFKTTGLGTDWTVVLDIRCMCEQGGTCPGVPCTTCFDCTTLPAVDGCLGGPTDGTTSLQCEIGICDGASLPFEMWDVQISRTQGTNLVVAVGGSLHACGMAFTSTNDGVNWKKESHECQSVGLPGGRDCSSDILYNDILGSSTHTFRLKRFETLYNASMFSGTNTALASGYSGQTVVRKPGTGVWEDRSYTTDRIDEVPSAVNFPMLGITAAATGSNAIMVGYGGTIRETTDAGQTWNDSYQNVPFVTEHSAPWRIHALRFTDSQTGYQAGQMGRIGTTAGNDGVGWGHDPLQGGHRPDRHADIASTLSSIVFSSSSNSKGVAVGGLLAPPSKWPMILYTTNPTSGGWLLPASVNKINGGTYEPLWDVCSAGVTSGGSAIYWAAGSGGFMLNSNDEGANWSQFNPSQYTSQKLGVDLFGVAFKDPSTGIFVGHGADPTGTPARPLAYKYVKNGTTVIWTDISPSLAGTIDGVLRDVVISGNTAYAVGEKTTSATPSVRIGVVVSSTWSGLGGFSTFTELGDSPQHGFPMSTTNDPRNDLESTPILLSAEIEPGLAGNLWIGGQCGRVWRRTAAPPTWTEFPKTQTNTHIEGISFPVAGTGFFGGNRTEEISNCLVRYKP